MGQSRRFGRRRDFRSSPGNGHREKRSACVLPELMSGVDCSLLFVGGNTTATSDLVQSGIVVVLRVLSIRLF